MPTLEQEAEAMKGFIESWKAIATMLQALEQSPQSCEILLLRAIGALNAGIWTPDGKLRTDIPEWQLVWEYKCADFIQRTTHFHMQQAAENGKTPEQIWEEGWKAFLMALKTFPPIMDGDIAEMENMPEAARLYGRLSLAGHIYANTKIYPRTKEALEANYTDLRKGFRTEVLKLAPLAWANWQPAKPASRTGNKGLAKLREMVVHDIEVMAGDDPEHEQLLQKAVETGTMPDIRGKSLNPLQILLIQAEIDSVAFFANRTLRKTEQRFVNFMLENPEMADEKDAVIGQALGLDAYRIPLLRQRLKAKWEAYQKKSENP